MYPKVFRKREFGRPGNVRQIYPAVGRRLEPGWGEAASRKGPTHVERIN
jgi:hypothetical protein